MTHRCALELYRSANWERWRLAGINWERWRLAGIFSCRANFLNFLPGFRVTFRPFSSPEGVK